MSNIFKCKMCGGTIEFESGSTVGECLHCGTKQTLPKLDDDRKTNLYDRANHFRRNNDYDKAAGIYEQILNEDPSDAEAYWSLVLCQYGIEYVEDPATHKRVPTVNRAQFTSIFDDDNYKSALQYSDTLQRTIYEQEANTINEIQKGILSISQKEDPFDVFICYKETDANGRRTPDSVLANDLYHQLTQEGFKVFFSRITLEDKLGTAYEPYIFAALNSAKVMVVLGTKPEYFNAVWVKNEWSRYLGLVKNSNGKKILIPAYKDMDPYDLPEEFSHLQAQDMGKLGFMQDLIRGIRKITMNDEAKPMVKEVVKEVVSATASSSNVEALLKRVEIFLEDENWDDADAYCEKVLDVEPENAQAYLGKLMVECQVDSRYSLSLNSEPLENYPSYRKVIRYADDELKKSIEGYNEEIKKYNENKRLTGLYNEAVNSMKCAKTEMDFKSSAIMFQKIAGFSDSDVLAQECLEKAESSRKDEIYESAEHFMAENTVDAYGMAIQKYESISGWKDSVEQVSVCKKRIDELRRQEEELRRKNEQIRAEKLIAEAKVAKKKKVVIASIFICIAIICIIFAIWQMIISPKLKFNRAMELLDKGEYDLAYTLLKELNKVDVIKSNKHDRAVTLLNSEDYEQGYLLLGEIGETDLIESHKYQRALGFMDSEDFESAYVLLDEIGAAEEITENKYERALSYIKDGRYEPALYLLENIREYKDGNSLYLNCRLKTDIEKLKNSKIGDIVTYGEYYISGDSKERIRWKLLYKYQTRVLLISEEAIENMAFYKNGYSSTWDSSYLRYWLNNDFSNEAFSYDEKTHIVEMKVNPDKNPDYDSYQGLSTDDKVFLLSITEANKYFSNDDERICRLTGHAGGGQCLWWLRTNGWVNGNMNAIALVSCKGVVKEMGYFDYATKTKDGDKIGVRPAMWVELN